MREQHQTFHPYLFEETTMSMTPTAAPSTEHWVHDDELETVLHLLGEAVAGLPDADTGEPIGSHGVGANTASRYENEVFSIRDYCWCAGSYHPEPVSEDDEDAYDLALATAGGEGAGCPANFEHKPSGIKAVWYKHLGRDVLFSRSAAAGEARQILAECLKSLPDPAVVS